MLSKHSPVLDYASVRQIQNYVLFKNEKPLLKKVFSVFIYIAILFFVNDLKAQPAGFVDQNYMDGWTQVVGFTWDEAGDKMYVWEKSGLIWVVDNGVTLPTPLLDISDEVGNWRDFGLLGFALDPNFLTNGYYYLNYLVDRHHLLNFGTPSYDPDTNDYFDASIGRVTRYQADINSGFTATVPGSRQILIGETKETGMPHLHESHGIGQIVFGTDGTLIVAMGDGASYSSTDQGSASETYWQQALTDGIITPAENIGAYRCQVLFSHNGKMMRIDPMTGDGVPSNPFYDSNNPRSPQSRTWSLGVRNPYRITKKPGTGSHDPSDADPGTFFFGDVGWGLWEDLNVISGPGQNFGWPKYEGITHMPGYNNPAYEPTSHRRPKIDFRHGQNVARGWVNGMMVSVGDPLLPGSPFRGNASTGGVWYTGSDFPPEYQNTYFHGDYGSRWIRSFVFDANNNPVEVKEFINDSGPVVYINTHPVTGSLYYVRYPNQIRKVSYTGSFNNPPSAQVSATPLNGPGPLSVQFTGDQSFDQDFDVITYSWNFGDGNSSTDANPMHTYNGTGSPQGYNVILTVSDGNLTDQASLNVSTDNTPPAIISTSIDNVNTFSVSNSTVLSLSATVADLEHSNGQLSFAWGVELHHNDHFHAEPLITNPTGTAVLTPVGCDGATYWYRIRLTVTDPVGASSEYVKDIYPDCLGSTQNITFPPITNKEITDAPFALNATTTSGLPITYYVKEGPAVVSGNIASLTGIPGTVTIVATQHGNTSFAPAVPVERTFQVTVPAGGSCTGSGTISREVWTNVSGTAVADIPVGTPPDIEDERTIFEIPVDVMENYGTRMRGYVCAPQTGQYTFWIASDDNGELLLSTNSDPANKVLIANVPQWTSSQEWDKFPSQQSAPITLIAGQTYYIEALQKEQGGGDNLAVGWQLPTGTLERPIPGNRLSPFNGFPPVAAFTASPLSGNAPLTVSFDATSSFDPDGNITDFDWDFGDGVTAAGANIFHTYTSVGDFTVVLTVTDNDGNTNSNSTVISVTNGMQNQTITFPSIPDKMTTDPPFQISATASSGLSVSFSIVSGPATISGDLITLTGAAGTVVVRASQAGDANYNPAPDVDQSFEVTAPMGGDIDLEMSLSTSDNMPTIYTNFSMTATISNTGNDPSNGIVVDFPLPTGVVFVGGNSHTASQGSYDAFSTEQWDVGTLNSGESATLQLNFFLLTSNPVTAFTQVIAANGNDVDSSPNNGTCCVSNEDDEAVLTVPMTGPQNQTITFPAIPNQETDSPPFNLNATASSGLAVTYIVLSGPATVSGNTVTLTGQVGQVTIEANQAGNTEWNPAPPVTQSFNVADPGLMDQTIAFSPIPDKQTDDLPFSVFATASSGLPVTFSIVSGPATVSGSTVTLTGSTGTVVVRASQPGNAQFNPAPDVDQTFNVSLPPGQGDMDLALTLTTSNTAPAQWSIFTVTATLTNDGPGAATNVELSFPLPDGVVFQGGNEFNASQGSYSTFNGNLWDVGTIAAGGNATLDLNFFLLSSDPVVSYAQVTAATEIDADSTPNNGTCCVANEDDEASLTVPMTGPANQTISFPSIPDKFTDDSPFTISASATSGLPVSFSIDSGPATISGNTITLTGVTGTVVVRASQGGDMNWNPAPDVTQSFTVADPGAQNQTINFPSIPNKLTTDPPFTVSATATSGLPVSFSIDSGPATLSGNTITLNGTAGTVIVRASQGGDMNWNPAPDVIQSFNVNGPPGNDEIDLELSISASSGTLNIWTNNTFTVDIVNNGAVTANNVVVDLPIPTGFAFTSVNTTQGSYDLFFQEWNVGSLAVGQTESIDLVLFVLQNSTQVDVFSQVIAADETDSDSTPNNNTSGTPSEDDEALASILPPGANFLGDNQEVLTLQAQRRGTTSELSWVSNMGLEGDQFIIEHSSDGVFFEPIKVKPSDVATDAMVLYQDEDVNPVIGSNYYRIKQELKNGMDLYSNVQILDFDQDWQDFILFPNPTTGKINLDLKVAIGKPISIKIIDRNGRAIWQEHIPQVQQQVKQLNLEAFREGNYFVWLHMEGRRPVVREVVLAKP